MKNIEFTSGMFKPIPGEEDETNPGIIGKALAEWLALKLITNGPSPEGVIPEDWGWLVVAHRKPFFLWIGCANIQDEQNRWRCFVVAEPNIIQRLFRKIKTKPYVETLHQRVINILSAEKNISDIREENR
jgi:hypothetical protein